MDFSRHKKAALEAARKASKVLQKNFGKIQKTKVKQNKSLVTLVDMESNIAIIRVIKKYFPEHSILSEETPFEDNNSDCKWIIDPIDGTHNFIHGVPFFGISIALAYKGNVALGVLSFPQLKLEAIAEKGKGALLNGKKIMVSSKGDLLHSYVCFEYSYRNRPHKIKFLRKIANQPLDLRNFGSAIYHLALVASGKSDAFIIHHTHPWDIAAGFLLVEEAGGKITDMKGKKWNLEQGNYIASNGRLHKRLLRLVK